MFAEKEVAVAAAGYCSVGRGRHEKDARREQQLQSERQRSDQRQPMQQRTVAEEAEEGMVPSAMQMVQQRMRCVYERAQPSWH